MTGQEILMNTVLQSILKSIGLTKEQMTTKLGEWEVVIKGAINTVVSKVSSIDTRTDALQMEMKYHRQMLSEIQGLLITALKDHAALKETALSGVVPCGDTYEPSFDEIARIVESASPESRREMIEEAAGLSELELVRK